MGFAATIIGSEAKERMLRFLLSHAKHSYGVSELAKLAHVPKASASRAVYEWGGSGLVSVTLVGNSKGVQLDSAFYLLPELKALLTKPTEKAVSQAEGFAKSVAAAVDGVIAVVLYGSVARGETDVHSDIDLLVITKSRAASLRAREFASENWGMHEDVSAVMMLPADVKARIEEKDKFMLSIVREGRVLYGREEFERITRPL
jgi:predicted nucleotidyltransferase